MYAALDVLMVPAMENWTSAEYAMVLPLRILPDLETGVSSATLV